MFGMFEAGVVYGHRVDVYCDWVDCGYPLCDLRFDMGVSALVVT